MLRKAFDGRLRPDARWRASFLSLRSERESTRVGEGSAARQGFGNALEVDQQQRARAREIHQLNADELVWRARWHMRRLTREDAQTAERLLDTAIAAQPNSAEALLEKGYADAWRLWNSGAGTEAIEQLRQRMVDARDLDPCDARGWLLLGILDMWLSRHDSAISLMREALGINPSLSFGYGHLGSCHSLSSRPAEALPLVRMALRLNPLDVHNFHQFGELALANLMLGDFAAAVAEADAALARRTGYAYGHALKTAARWMGGDRDAARDAAAFLRRARPGYDPSALEWLLLGDERSAIGQWRFSDGQGLANGAQAILVLYGHEAGLTHADLVSGHLSLLGHFGCSHVHTVPCGMAKDPNGEPSLHYEPFGFRDGVSQPVIAGSRRAAIRTAPGDHVAAGEILIGYRNDQGYMPITIEVGSERDPACELPTVSASDTDRFPRFGGGKGASEARDFGRNGSFMAVRQLDQDVPRFWEQAERASERLRSDFPGLKEVAGPDLTADWVAARIIGRWSNGSPLVGNPDASAAGFDPSSDNLFEYGVDDPRGLACPLGAHIRRTNPRGSQEPGDVDELRITNRHRMLRRGRSYAYTPPGDGATRREGLLFMALCADLERQFEFVQRTWINSTVFHGLVDEHDPLLGPGLGGGKGGPGYFTIPTVAGPVRVAGLRSCVTVQGGGYFFVPSRSALAHLVTRSRL